MGGYGFFRSMGEGGRDVNGKFSSSGGKGTAGAVHCPGVWAVCSGCEWFEGGVARVYEALVDRAVGVRAEVQVQVEV